MVAALLVAALAAAPTFDASLEDALDAADRAPSVAAARAALAAKREGDARVSRLPGNPQLAIQPGWRVARSQDQGPEAQVSLSQPLSLAGLGGARARALTAEEAELEADLVSIRLGERLNAIAAWLGLWSAEGALRSSESELQVATEILQKVERLAAAGALTRADAAAARSYLAEARLQLLAAEGQRFEQQARLAKHLARPGTLPSTRGAPPEAPVPPEEKWLGLIARAGDSAPAAVARARHAAELARIDEVRALRGTGVQLGVQALRDSPGGLVLFGTATFTLPAFDRGERETATAAALAEKREGEHRDAELESARTLQLALHETAHSGEVLAAVQDALLPAAREAAELRQKQLEAGSTTLLEVLTARRALRAAEGRLWQARADHLFARLEAAELVSALEAITGSTP